MEFSGKTFTGSGSEVLSKIEDYLDSCYAQVYQDGSANFCGIIGNWDSKFIKECRDKLIVRFKEEHCVEYDGDIYFKDELRKELEGVNMEFCNCWFSLGGERIYASEGSVDAIRETLINRIIGC